MQENIENRTAFFHRPITWIALLILSLGSVWVAQRYFSEAFPLVALDLQMDRVRALEQSAQRVETHGWGPKDYKQAASFELDGQTQHFVELEGGGNAAFAEMLAGNLYAPYQWKVRHFQQGSVHEVTLSFKPDGTWYGFEERLPEDEPGAALPADAARQIAVAAATELGIALDAYQPISASEEIRLSKRVDHNFVFERPESDLGEGRYRLRLVVSGDQLTALKHEVFVPEAFTRQYTEMRSANETLAAGASVAMLLLYVVGGAIGTFFLLRQRWVLWKTALRWGLIVGGLQGAVLLNQIPLSWMYYDTAISTQAHIVEQLISAVVATVGMTLLFAFSFLMAESLSRRAFPHHIRFWNLWSPSAAASPQVLGQTVGGYLLIGPMFAFVVGFYHLNSQLLDWWNPSSALFEPNVLAAYFPWLSSIAISLQAGFWEECLFRAIPLAGAAMLGQRYGRPRLWIAGAFLIQMVIFGAAHANYPAQPAYARVVELLIPSAVFGFLYLRFGLLPAIVMHFAYDVVWFAMPLFVAESPGLLIDQALVIALAFIPLAVPIVYRCKQGAWKTVEERDYNASWQPAPEEAPPMQTQPIAQVVEGPARARYAWMGAGLLGIGLSVYGLVGVDHSKLTLTVDRQDAISAAREALTDAGIALDDTWEASVRTAVTAATMEHAYVWRTWEPSVYERLLGIFLSAPHWQVRFARFDEKISVEDRAEEYRVYINRTGQLMGIDHQTPEGWPGPELEDAQASALAENALVQRFGIQPEEVERISADIEKRPARRDWRFVFSQDTALPEAPGQARISVVLAGDRVERLRRFVHIPEEWQRAEREREQTLIVFRVLSAVLLFGTLGIMVVYALLRWSKGQINTPTLILFFIAFLTWGALMQANGWSAGDFTLSTTEPLGHQLLMRIIGAVLLPAAGAFFIALLAGAVPRWSLPVRSVQPDYALGMALGAAGLGVTFLGEYLSRDFEPVTLTYSGADDFLSWLPIAVQGFPFLSLALAGGVGLWSIFTQHGTRRHLLGYGLVFLLGAAPGGMSQQHIEGIALSGLVGGLFALTALTTALRFDVRLCWIAAGTQWIFGQIKQAVFVPFPGAQIGALLGICIVSAIAWWWLERLRDEVGQTEDSAAA